MTGKDAAALRMEKGYTQGALAQLLEVSTPTVCRREAEKVVPSEYAARLQALPPAPTSATGRGAYRREQEKPARRSPLQTARARPSPAPASSPPPPATSVPAQPQEEPVLEADAAGAVLLEGESLLIHLERVTACYWLLRWKRELRKAGGAPCR